MQQATTPPATTSPYHLHRVTTRGHTTPLGDSIHIEVEFSLDPQQLERQATPDHAEIARRLIQELTADLLEVQVVSSPEEYLRYEEGLRSRAAKDELPNDLDPARLAPDPGPHFKLADIAPVWSAEGHPTHAETHRTAYLPNPTVQAIELRTEGTRTYFRWSESFKANPAVEGLIEHLREQARDQHLQASQAPARLQQLVNTLAALTHFLD